MTAEEWFVTAFGPDYQAVYAHRDDDSANAEIAGITPRLQAAGGPVLDLGCGNGRHLAAMRQAGIHAYGCDLSEHLLADASQRPGLVGSLARLDMRRLPFATHSFTAITLLFTAFGYFDDQTNQSTLSGCHQVLKPGGWLVLDLPNRQHVIDNLVASSSRTLADGRELSEVRRWDGQRVTKTVTISGANGIERDYTEDVRLYSNAEITSMLTTAGIETVDVWSSLQGSDLPGNRMVVWGQAR